jgi:hypothetical protein
LGAATATTINKVTITQPASGSTLTIADGKTLTLSNTLTFTGTDSSSVAFGAGGTVVYTTTTQTLSAKTLTSPTITTSPTAAGATWADLGTVTTADINGGTIDGVTIGGASAGAGTFTTLTVNTNLNPDANDGAGLGTTALGWSDLFFASGAVINWNNGDVTITHSANALAFAGAASGYSFDAALSPATNDGASLGTTTNMWSDAFFASGAVLNFDNGDVTITHAANTLSFAGASTYNFDAALYAVNLLPINGGHFMAATGNGNVAYLSAWDVDGTTTKDFITLTSGNTPTATMSDITASSNFTPTTSDGAALGTASLQWSDLFLASGAVLNFANGDVTLTHTANTLTIAGGTLVTAAASIAGTLDIQQAMTLSGDISPTQLTADVNDYAPTGFATASVLRLSADAARSITGIAGGSDGRVIVLRNVGSFDITLPDGSASSTAGNRFKFGADFTLGAGKATTLIYDATDSAWYHAVTPGSSSGGGGSGGAPVDAQYIVAVSHGDLTAERVATDTNSITWDFATGGQAKASVVNTVANGLTGVSTLTNHGVLLGQGTSAIVATTAGTAGQVLKSGGASADPAFADDLACITWIIDGGASVIATGSKYGLRVPFACTIVAATIAIDQTGSIVVDIWKDTQANYPPTDADSITASAQLTISSATKAEDTTLTGWTTAISAGDWLFFNVDSVTSAKFCTITLKVKKA